MFLYFIILRRTIFNLISTFLHQNLTLFGAHKRILSFGPHQANFYLSPVRAAKVQASLRIRAVLPEPPLLPHTGSESRGTFRQKARSLTPLIGWACAVKICHDGMLEDLNSLDSAHFIIQTKNKQITDNYANLQNIFAVYLPRIFRPSLGRKMIQTEHSVQLLWHVC